MSEATKLPLNALRAFEAVAAHLSFTGAAQSLNVTTAAVSSHIKSLEEFLETPLFVRHSRSVRLTPQGARLLPGIQRGMGELTRAVDQLRQDRSSGLLNISLLGSFLQKWLLPRLGDFYQKHPEVDLRFNASRELVDFMQTDFHAAVRYGGGDWPQLQAEKMLDDWVFPVTSPALLAKLGRIDDARSISTSIRCCTAPASRGSIGCDASAATRCVPSAGPILDDSASVLAAAEQGHGLALARWSLVAGDLASGRLVRPSGQSVRQHNSYYFVAPAHHFELPKVIRFRDWLREVCSQFPPPEGERLEP